MAAGLNVYGFANGDPVDFSDPFGLCPGLNESPSPYDCPPGYFELLGTIAGFFGGGAAGGAAGLLAAAPTGETGAPLTVPAGVVAGAVEGAVAGFRAGAIVDGIVHLARAGKGGGNSAENRGSNYWAKKYNLNKDGKEQLKRALELIKGTGEDVTDEMIEEEAKSLQQIPKYVSK